MPAQRFRITKCPSKTAGQPRNCIIIGGIPNVVKKTNTAEPASSRYENLKANVKNCES
jgi:hypothetical protein